MYFLMPPNPRKIEVMQFKQITYNWLEVAEAKNFLIRINIPIALFIITSQIQNGGFLEQ